MSGYRQGDVDNMDIDLSAERAKVRVQMLHIYPPEFDHKYAGIQQHFGALLLGSIGFSGAAVPMAASSVLHLAASGMSNRELTELVQGINMGLIASDDIETEMGRVIYVASSLLNEVIENGEVPPVEVCMTHSTDPVLSMNAVLHLISARHDSESDVWSNAKIITALSVFAERATKATAADSVVVRLLSEVGRVARMYLANVYPSLAMYQGFGAVNTDRLIQDNLDGQSYPDDVEGNVTAFMEANTEAMMAIGEVTDIARFATEVAGAIGRASVRILRYRGLSGKDLMEAIEKINSGDRASMMMMAFEAADAMLKSDKEPESSGKGKYTLHITHMDGDTKDKDMQNIRSYLKKR